MARLPKEMLDSKKFLRDFFEESIEANDSLHITMVDLLDSFETSDKIPTNYQKSSYPLINKFGIAGRIDKIKLYETKDISIKNVMLCILKDPEAVNISDIPPKVLNLLTTVYAPKLKERTVLDSTK